MSALNNENAALLAFAKLLSLTDKRDTGKITDAEWRERVEREIKRFNDVFEPEQETNQTSVCEI